MPMKEGYGKEPKGNSLDDNPKLLDKLRNENHRALKNIPEIK